MNRAASGGKGDLARPYVQGLYVANPGAIMRVQTVLILSASATGTPHASGRPAGPMRAPPCGPGRLIGGS